MSKRTIESILQKKQNDEKITMLTAYDYPLAKLIDQAGVDIVLVGDSLANVVLGLASTKEIGMPEMLHHTKAAARGVSQALLVGDMPYGSHANAQEAVANAKRFVEEARADAVKVEWSEGCVDVIRAIGDAGIPVMGHVGLTPQTAENFKVQGKDASSARRILEQARQLEEAGIFSIVLECVPSALAEHLSLSLKIPTIGIGAGKYCDGQVLVAHDVLGLFDRFQPKFAKRYVHLSPLITAAVKDFCREVQREEFPTDKHSFLMDKEALKELESL